MLRFISFHSQAVEPFLHSFLIVKGVVEHEVVSVLACADELAGLLVDFAKLLIFLLLTVSRTPGTASIMCWIGCKDAGRGGALSVIGYQNLTRPKSYHLKKA